MVLKKTEWIGLFTYKNGIQKIESHSLFLVDGGVVWTLILSFSVYFMKF